jgi:hypothetical protein
MSDTIIRQCTLQNTDLTGKVSGCVKLGSNKFWKGWVVDHGDGTGDFCCQWGSTGTKGKTTGSKHNIPLSTAINLYEKKRANKLSKKKGYTELETRTQDEEVKKAAQKGIDLTKGKKASPKKAKPAGRIFHPEVSRLLRVIFDSNSNAVRSGLSAQAGATKDNPIGNLSDNQLDIGGGVLDEIGVLLERKFGREDPSNKSTTLPLSRGGAPSDRIIDLTNRYYSNVPRPIGLEKRGRKNLPKLVVSSFERLQAEREFMQLLRDAHLAKGVFQAAAQASTTVGGKEEVWFDGLGCEIEHLASGHKDRKWAEEVFSRGLSRRNANWWRGSSPRVGVNNVWRFTRKGSTTAFDKYKAQVEKKKGAVGTLFAWHGTRRENLLGIGKSGLLMPENLPRGVVVTGKAFGNGVYHAPVMTDLPKIAGHKTDGTNGAFKSMNYTGHSQAYYGGRHTGTVFMFLEELSLGVPQVLTRPSWSQKRPVGWPEKDWVYACAGGCSTLAHDEVVTFREDAQVFRYLMEFSVR